MIADRNQTVDALRALAALWVCLFHFTSATGVGTYGYLGVTIVFVISGFIMPYSIAGALAASIAGAAVLRRCVEQPALRLSARIGYRSTQEAPNRSPQDDEASHHTVAMM